MEREGEMNSCENEDIYSNLHLLRRRNIYRQIQSILNLFETVDGIIICDDNSTDRTKEILTGFHRRILFKKFNC